MRGFAITAQGAQLLTKVAGGAGTLQITAVKVGKGLPEGDPSLLTDLVSPVALGSCTVPKVENNRMSMVVEYRNDMDGGLKEDFMLSEFGIFAKVKELEEDAVLLYIGVLGDNPGVVSAWNGNNLESRRYPVSIVVSKDLQVEIDFPAGAFITSDEFDEAMETHNKSISSHSDIRAMATETYNSETTYTAGAYCIHDGKLYKAQVDISAPEEWTESHWTLTSVGAELRELETALSNKLSNVASERVQIPDRSVFKDFMIGKPYGYYFVYGEDLVEGMPTNDRVWWFVWNVPSGIWAYRDNSNRVWRTEFTNGFLYRWREVAFCDPPQEYDLPLAEGWVGSIRYSKTQEGLVSLFVNIGKATTIGVGTFQVGTLPVGFQPRNEVSCAAINTAEAILKTASRLVVNPSGGILLQQADETASGIFASITFVS